MQDAPENILVAIYMHLVSFFIQETHPGNISSYRKVRLQLHTGKFFFIQTTTRTSCEWNIKLVRLTLLLWGQLANGFFWILGGNDEAPRSSAGAHEAPRSSSGAHEATTSSLGAHEAPRSSGRPMKWQNLSLKQFWTVADDLLCSSG
jgi:hypothetical protein